ncbi:hypothetical protein RF11_09799 [Thelohanellus kitauei]|uniref:Uncharacterized protein n=1 Tax=Thelohanellus kitauei TaxID=669202 RepID=A0A0C2N0V0_THEKT|nr:hypothetical protein RF11_09799 [Thelohanellus kitauei]
MKNFKLQERREPSSNKPKKLLKWSAQLIADAFVGVKDSMADNRTSPYRFVWESQKTKLFQVIGFSSDIHEADEGWAKLVDLNASAGNLETDVEKFTDLNDIEEIINSKIWELVEGNTLNFHRDSDSHLGFEVLLKFRILFQLPPKEQLIDRIFEISQVSSAPKSTHWLSNRAISTFH